MRKEEYLIIEHTEIGSYSSVDADIQNEVKFDEVDVLYMLLYNIVPGKFMQN